MEVELKSFSVVSISSQSPSEECWLLPIACVCVVILHICYRIYQSLFWKCLLIRRVLCTMFGVFDRPWFRPHSSLALCRAILFVYKICQFNFQSFVWLVCVFFSLDVIFFLFMLFYLLLFKWLNVCCLTPCYSVVSLCVRFSHSISFLML